jgi:hypothetical protein
MYWEFLHDIKDRNGEAHFSYARLFFFFQRPPSIAPQPSTGRKASSQTSFLAAVVVQLTASPACQAAKFGA